MTTKDIDIGEKFRYKGSDVWLVKVNDSYAYLAGPYPHADLAFGRLPLVNDMPIIKWTAINEIARCRRIVKYLRKWRKNERL